MIGANYIGAPYLADGYDEPGGPITVTGVATVALGNLSVTATSRKTVLGPTTVGLGSLAITASSRRTVFGVPTVALGSLSVTATGQGSGPTTVTGVATVALGNLSVSAHSQRLVYGVSAAPLGSLSVEATGTGGSFTPPVFIFTAQSRSDGTVYCSPRTFQMLRVEEWPLGFDMTNLLDNTTPSSPQATLYDLNTNVTIDLADLPGLDGNIIAQVIRGSQLTAQHGYRLTVTCNAALDQTVSTVLLINVAIPTP